MTTGSWRNRIREARPIRDVLGMVLLAATALLYAAERHRAEAAERAVEAGAAVVVDVREGVELLPVDTVLQGATAASDSPAHGRG